MIEFFTIPRTINIIFWLLAVFFFHRAVFNKRKLLWNGIIGDDRKIQPREIAILFWCLLFPEVVFIQLLIIVTNLKIDKDHLDLFAWIEGALTLLAGTVIIKGNGKNTDNIRGGDQEKPVL